MSRYRPPLTWDFFLPFLLFGAFFVVGVEAFAAGTGGGKTAGSPFEAGKETFSDAGEAGALVEGASDTAGAGTTADFAS